MSKQQTAVEWLEKEIKSYIEYPIPIRSYSQIFYWFYQAKQKEKEQIIDAFHSKKIINTISAEQYYKQTYGGDHE